MRSFYEGFEKRAGIGSRVKGLGKKTVDHIKDLAKRFDDVNRELVFGRNIRVASDDASRIFANTFKRDVMPEVNKAIDRAKKGGLEVNLDRLKTIKGGVLPAVAVGAGFEAGRRAIDAAAKFPDYAQKKREAYKNR